MQEFVKPRQETGGVGFEVKITIQIHFDHRYRIRSST